MKKFAHVFLFLCVYGCAPAAATFVSFGAVELLANQLVGTPTQTVSGVLIYGGPGSNPVPEWRGKIVLVDRTPGGVDFVTKLANVLTAGGLACIVANNADPIFLGQLPAGVSSVLPTVTVSQTDGAMLRTKEGTMIRIGDHQVPVIDPLPNQSGQAGGVLMTDGSKASWGKIIAIGGATTATIKAGKSIVFVVTSDGTPPVAYQWAKDGTAIQGATDTTLPLASITSTDAGSYVCTATNSAGATASGPFKLIVDSTP